MNNKKTKLTPLIFVEANTREKKEFAEQLGRLKEFYGEEADFVDPVFVGEEVNSDTDAIVFPQLIGAAFRHKDELKEYNLPMVVLTSPFGTVEMWDWEIITFLRSEGMNVFSPYKIELAKTIIRAFAAKRRLERGARFLMFQDTPGEGMQANIFKRFYWWERECIEKLEKTFGLQVIYKSWKELGSRAKEISDSRAKETYESWEIEESGVCERAKLSATKIYMAIKDAIDQLGGVDGVGSNCLNESFHCDTTPCLAWNMIFEKDDIIWACEGDMLTMISTFILYRSLKVPMMMTNLYPFLTGMAALAHEKIDRFPEIEDPDNHALGVHCGYFGFVPRSFCTKWIMRPKVLEIVDENSIVIDAEFPKGPITIAKIHPDFHKLTVIEAEIEAYVQYPGSDCRNGALIKYKDGERVMEELCSHHAVLISGRKKAELYQVSKVFGWEMILL